MRANADSGGSWAPHHSFLRANATLLHISPSYESRGRPIVSCGDAHRRSFSYPGWDVFQSLQSSNKRDAPSRLGASLSAEKWTHAPERCMFTITNDNETPGSKEENERDASKTANPSLKNKSTHAGLRMSHLGNQ